MLRDERKVQPLLTQATGGRETDAGEGELDDLKSFCEDEEDPEGVYAIYRGRISGASFHLVDIVNAFGECGGFDAILERFS